MALIAAEELGVGVAEIEVVSGDTERCPYSIGEKGRPSGGEELVASATPEPPLLL
jgi:hypothetical protein